MKLKTAKLIDQALMDAATHKEIEDAVDALHGHRIVLAVDLMPLVNAPATCGCTHSDKVNGFCKH